MPRARKAGAIPRTVALVFLATPFFHSGWAASDPLCGRYALQELAPGMSHDMIRRKTGVEGVRTLVRIPGRVETSGVDYPSPTASLYVEYDHRVDRRPPARAVRVRVAMPLSPTTAQTLVSRFGPPDAGADDLMEGLPEGAAVWVDEDCGVVLTAYRPTASWWAAEGGIFLQVETLSLARDGGSPASPLLGAILARKNGPPATPVPTISEPLAPPPPLSMQITAAPDDVSPGPPPVARAIPVPLPIEPVAAPSPPAPKPQRAIPVPLPVELVAAPSPSAPKPQRAIKPSNRPAERITFVPPVYPAKAKWLGVKGHVTLAIVVRADGSVANGLRIVATRPAGRGFEAAAVDAVRMWRFKPALRGGRPVVSTVSVDVDFE